MRVPVPLSEAFGAQFESQVAEFCTEKKLLPEVDAIRSPRFLTRSVIPHIKKLSTLFNRLDAEKAEKGEKRISKVKDQSSGLEPYWKESSNPANLRLAYFLYFMPSNLFRVAAVWSELGRLGFRWQAKGPLRALELGAGPASGACGIAAGEKHARVGLPREGNWALIEQDKATLELGAEWAQSYFASQDIGDWGIRPFHRKLDLSSDLLPASAPSFNLWIMSYFLNESTEPPRELAERLIKTWEKHLDEEGLVVLVEPALKLQSRRLLELRKELLAASERTNAPWLKILVPCLGHQACGALAAEDDWCHEEVSWWRPPYFRKIDQMAGLDRKTLPFSYLVIARTYRSLEDCLPALAPVSTRERLVSPAHFEGKEQEFFLCGQEGKRRARYRARDKEETAANLERGDILGGAEVRGDVHSARVEKINRVL